MMNAYKLGALVVVSSETGGVEGMFTERDVLTRVLGAGVDPARMTVGDVMTRHVICCQPTDDLNDVGLLMKEKRIRHVPVCDPAGDLLGLISIGDVNAYHVGHQEQTISQLSDYIYGRA